MRVGLGVWVWLHKVTKSCLLCLQREIRFGMLHWIRSCIGIKSLERALLSKNQSLYGKMLTSENLFAYCYVPSRISSSQTCMPLWAASQLSEAMLQRCFKGAFAFMPTMSWKGQIFYCSPGGLARWRLLPSWKQQKKTMWQRDTACSSLEIPNVTDTSDCSEVFGDIASDTCGVLSPLETHTYPKWNSGSCSVQEICQEYHTELAGPQESRPSNTVMRT